MNTDVGIYSPKRNRNHAQNGSTWCGNDVRKTVCKVAVGALSLAASVVAIEKILGQGGHCGLQPRWGDGLAAPSNLTHDLLAQSHGLRRAQDKTTLFMASSMRSTNAYTILDQVTGYAAIDEVLLWDTGRGDDPTFNYAHPKVVVLRSEQSLAASSPEALWRVASWASHPRIFLQEDDQLFAEPAITRLLDAHKREPRRPTCYVGRSIAAPDSGGSFHYNASDVATPALAPICLPRGMVTTRALILAASRFAPKSDERGVIGPLSDTEVDIWQALSTVNFTQQLHLVLPMPHNGCKTLFPSRTDRDKLGGQDAELSAQRDHFTRHAADSLGLQAHQLYVQPYTKKQAGAMLPASQTLASLYGRSSTTRLLYDVGQSHIEQPTTIVPKQPLDGDLAMCAVLRGEGDVTAWLDHHRRMGASAFYFFEFNTSMPMPSRTPYDSLARGDFFYQYITNSSGTNPIVDVYNECRDRFAKSHRWMAFTDVDEYLIPLAGSKNLPQILFDYGSFGGLAVNRRQLGAFDAEQDSESGLLDSQTRCYPQSDEDCTHFKLIVNTKYALQIIQPNLATYRDGKYLVTETKQRVDEPYDRTQQASMNRLALFHYGTESAVDFDRKATENCTQAQNLTQGALS